jgi:hypothetical protein
MKTSIIVIALFLASVILETGVAYVIRKDWTPDKLEADEYEYYNCARQLLEGHYSFDARRTIGHVLILSTIRAVVGERLLFIQFGVSFLFSAIVPFTYLLVRREMGSWRAALLAGLSVMLWPPFIWYGATLFSEAAALPFFSALLLAIPGTRGSDALRTRRWFGAGALLAICMHIRPMYLLYSPFAALIAYWRGPKGLRGLCCCLALTVGCLALILPWSIAASIHNGSFVLLSTIGGEVFGGGMNPELLRLERDGQGILITPGGRSTWVGPGKWIRESETGLLSPEEQALPYSEKGKVLTKNALAWAGRNPGDASYLTLRKLTYMWGIYPFWNGRAQTILGNVPTVGLLIVAGAAIVVYRRHLRAFSVFWTPVLFVTLVGVIFWGSWRFREPGDLGLIALAASLPFAAEVNRFLASAKEANRGV